MNSLKSCIWTSCPSNWQELCSKKCQYRKVEDHDLIAQGGYSMDCEQKCDICAVHGDNRCCKECVDKYTCPVKCGFLAQELGEVHLYEDK